MNDRKIVKISLVAEWLPILVILAVTQYLDYAFWEYLPWAAGWLVYTMILDHYVLYPAKKRLNAEREKRISQMQPDLQKDRRLKDAEYDNFRHILGFWVWVYLGSTIIMTLLADVPYGMAINDVMCIGFVLGSLCLLLAANKWLKFTKSFAIYMAMREHKYPMIRDVLVGTFFVIPLNTLVMIGMSQYNAIQNGILIAWEVFAVFGFIRGKYYPKIKEEIEP